MSIQIVPITAANEAEWKRRCAASVNQIIQYLGTLAPASGLVDGDYGDIVVSGSGTAINFDSSVVTTFAKTFLDDVDAAAVRTTIGAQVAGSYLTGNQTITLSGDATGSGATSITTTLATVNANVGSFGSSTAIPVITVNGKGLITAVSTAAPSTDLGVLHVQDQKAASTDGGTFTSGAWQTRVLNTAVVNTITSASLSSNQISLPAGTYDIFASAPALQVNRHQTRLQNITDGSTILLGTTDHSRNTSATDGNSTSALRGRFTIAGTKTIELQHRCETTVATAGFGSGSGNSWGTTVFADVLIKRIA